MVSFLKLFFGNATSMCPYGSRKSGKRTESRFRRMRDIEKSSHPGSGQSEDPPGKKLGATAGNNLWPPENGQVILPPQRKSGESGESREREKKKTTFLPQ